MRIKGQADIEVFISDGGYICLKQTDEVDGERVIEFAARMSQFEATSSNSPSSMPRLRRARGARR